MYSEWIRYARALPLAVRQSANSEALVQGLRARLGPAINAIRRRTLYSHVGFGRKVLVDDKCSFEDNVHIGPDCTVLETNMGRYSFLAFRDWVRNTTVGRFCSIGPNVIIGIGRHPARDFVSSHPAMYSEHYRGALAHHDFAEHLPVKIGSDVWIGANVFVGPGISIGDGAIVGTGAVVVRDVLPYQVVGGVPAKVIRDRFQKEDVEFLLSSRWWEWSDERLRALGGSFNDVRAFRSTLSVEAGTQEEQG